VGAPLRGIWWLFQDHFGVNRTESFHVPAASGLCRVSAGPWCDSEQRGVEGTDPPVVHTGDNNLCFTKAKDLVGHDS